MFDEDARTWANEVPLFLAAGTKSDLTRKMYERDLRRFAEWCATLSYVPLRADAGQVHEFAGHLGNIGHKPRTIYREMTTVRVFFGFLAARGVIATNPIADLRWSTPPLENREVPTVGELREIWSGCKDDNERATVGLLGFCGMRPSEVESATFANLGEVEGHQILRVPARNNQFQRPYVVIPEPVSAAIANLRTRLGSGAIIRTGWDNSVDRNSLRTIVMRIGSRTSLRYELKPLDLTFCLRSIAVERGFAYGEVVRSVGEAESRRLAIWAARSTGAIEDHPALRLSRLVLPTKPDSLAAMEEAGTMLRLSDAHPAAATAFAGAALEKHLRDLARENEIPLRGEGKLSAYAAVLKSRGVIDNRTLQSINRLQDIRNDAAHGWFERVSSSDAAWFITNATELIRRYPLTEPGSLGQGD
ncbi:tyrosine-type recombinase/integrase [Microbacterium sp. Clip185]|uniref:tyrosine-type recombinase/integrase n=1 Tax=Microbacterium sp. Clip185 TaxID=3025663 RepID=UPI002365FCF4|nr:site-specific integrase [Microbacterium sp. Clip185]WDG16858.1 site-specific integrase [Microbacterium sp. Clip185]